MEPPGQQTVVSGPAPTWHQKVLGQGDWGLQRRTAPLSSRKGSPWAQGLGGTAKAGINFSAFLGEIVVLGTVAGGEAVLAREEVVGGAPEAAVDELPALATHLIESPTREGAVALADARLLEARVSHSNISLHHESLI